MYEIILSVGVYVGVLVLLVKAVFTYCDNSHDNVVTEP